MKNKLKQVEPGQNFVNDAKEVLRIEIEAIQALSDNIDINVAKACQLMLDTEGHIIVTGMGKSGHIANKISATLASTGTPAFFVHPGEANHGDLGMITSKDIVIAISNSGNSEEILGLMPRLMRLNIPVISLTGAPNSPLAKNATVHIDVSVPQEACPLGLAPTSSTTATLALGDALAIALLKAKGFTREDFAFSHPAGALGKRLLIRVDDIMHKGNDMPIVKADTSVSNALIAMSAKSLGMVAIIDENDRLLGIFTDGDLRRTLNNQALNIRSTMIVDVMTTHCVHVAKDMLAAEALKIMETKKINGCPVCDADGKLIGIFNMHDLLRAKIL